MAPDPTGFLEPIRTPALLLDRANLDANLDAMARRCQRLGVALRPHVKTHKCVEIARGQRRRGANGITVATLEEAEVFADHGFGDITWAFPLVIERLDQALALSRRVRLGLTLDSEEALDALEAADQPISAWLKVDCGYHRAGVQPASERALRLASRLSTSSVVTFAGLLTHSGHAYHPGPESSPQTVAREERDVMVGFGRRLEAAGIEVPEISVGSTPAMRRAEDLSGIDEARPGNYALFDLTQVALGSCTVGECAATVLASVVSTGPDHCVIDAGALALSKDLGPSSSERPRFGAVFADYPAGRLATDLRVTSLSQEHGIVDRPLPVGRRLRILPNHSCLTVAQFDEFVVVSEGRAVERWKIHRRR